MNLISKAFLLSVVLSGVLTVTIPSTYKLTCRDEKGSAVDWFTVYKLPKLSDNTVSPWIQDGSGYAYMTEKNQTLTNNWKTRLVINGRRNKKRRNSWV